LKQSCGGRRAPARQRERSAAKMPVAAAAPTGLSEWLQKNATEVARADEIIAERLSDPKSFGDHTCMSLCDDVFGIVRQSLIGEGGDGCSSVLLLGEACSGKTHAVEWCIERLRDAQRSLVVLRAFGRSYASDAECVRHLVTQVAGQLPEQPRGNASFEQIMEWLRQVLTDRFRTATSAVIILDRFEHFCSRARQTLLYNLFDIAQEVGVKLSIIGMSEKMDVMSMLEKRIKSRFSMRHLHAFRPVTMADLVPVLMSKFRLAASCDLKAPFRIEFARRVEAALWAKAAQWQHHLELGRTPTWFLWQCLPAAALLHDAAAAAESKVAQSQSTEASSAKRPRLSGASPGSLPSASGEEVRALLLGSLSEAEHIVLIALFRLRSRQASATLAKALYEVQLLHQGGGFVATFTADRYCAAFDRLRQLRLVELSGMGAGETPERYLPCQSLVNHIYGDLVVDLERSGAGAGSSSAPLLPWNPLRALPQAVQQWASRQRS